MKGWIKKLHEMSACQEAIDWAEQYDSLQEAWDACPRGDWMGWLLDRLEVNKKQKMKLYCMNMRLALPFTDDKRVRHTIEVIEAWVEGKATAKDIKAIVEEAWSAALAATWAAGTVARAVAEAATMTPEEAALAATWTPEATTRTAFWAAWAARRRHVRTVPRTAELRVLQQCADNTRKMFPTIKM
jgi:hypothetical protein